MRHTSVLNHRYITTPTKQHKCTETNAVTMRDLLLLLSAVLVCGYFASRCAAAGDSEEAVSNSLVEIIIVLDDQRKNAITNLLAQCLRSAHVRKCAITHIIKITLYSIFYILAQHALCMCVHQYCVCVCVRATALHAPSRGASSL